LAVPGALLEYNGAHKKAQGALGQLGLSSFSACSRTVTNNQSLAEQAGFEPAEGY
jgi:hypothetical protein